jgi:hypothetical protein
LEYGEFFIINPSHLTGGVEQATKILPLDEILSKKIIISKATHSFIPSFFSLTSRHYYSLGGCSFHCFKFQGIQSLEGGDNLNNCKLSFP